MIRTYVTALLLLFFIAPVAFGSTLESASAESPRPRTITFEERVHAQEAIDRVYYSHQSGGVKRPFEAVLPRDSIEQEVRTYLEQSAALDRLWRTPVTAEMLEHELARMVRGSRMPERLRELFAALDNDPFLLEECLARPTLVSRLVQNFYAYDERLHADSRARAEDLRALLLRGEIDARQDHPARRESVLTVGRSVFPEHEQGPTTTKQDLARWRDLLPSRIGEIGAVEEDRTSFLVRVLLGDTPEQLRFATYTIEKRSREAWWYSVSASFNELSVAAVARGNGVPPALSPTNSVGPCFVDETWDNGLLDDIPQSSDATSVWTGTVMIFWGGYPFTDRGSRYDPATDTWSPTSLVGAPSPRDRHTAIWTGTRMLIYGGLWQGADSGTVYPLGFGGSYDPVTDRWDWALTDPGVGRYDHTAIWTGTEMIVWGGDGDRRTGNTGWRFNPTTGAWSEVSTVGARAMDSHVAVWTGKEMIVWDALGYGGRYDPQTDTWRPVSSPPGKLSGCCSPTAVWTGQVMVVLGTGRYDPMMDSWSPISPQGAQSGQAVWTGSEVVVVGDGTGGRYDPIADEWKALSPVNAPRGTHPTMVWTGDRVISWGVRSGGRYDPTTDIWTPVSTGNGPLATGEHVAIWTGNQMIVWPAGDRCRYDPTTDSWASMSVENSPSPSGATAVWTGTEMLLWGYSGSLYGTGGRYDPMQDKWVPITTAGAPVSRYQHSAIWTGAEMIVWGGLDGTFLLNTGGRYDPTTDSWTPMSIVGAPLPRSLHTAVWTGAEMIVWGGHMDPSWSMTGGRYDPATDLWRPTSLVHAPPNVWNHTAVWTGTDMLLWGGYGPDVGQTNGGARYDPAADRWLPTGGSAPSPRWSHTAVWTGDRMLVWGGQAGYDNFCLGTGGSYDPTGDAWTPITMTGAPTQRWAHTAIWTGSFMIVWGGYYTEGLSSGLLASGGRYAPAHAVDADGDGVCDSPDNCPAFANPDQIDTDSDGVGDGCDDCPIAYNPSQSDVDADGVGDLCDNCGAEYNQTQSDSDHDGEGDACDVNDGLIWQFSPDHDHIAWQAEAGFTSWHVYEGDLDVLKGTGVYTQVPGSNPLAERRCGVTDILVDDFNNPPVGKTVFSLVTGSQNGIEGSLGRSSQGIERPNTSPCP